MKTVKEWLAQNNYEDVLKKIHAVEQGWKRKGTGTRRDWWEVLAGNQDGSPKTIEGKKFPILCAARKRKGWPATEECLCRNPNEKILPIVSQPRWEKLKAQTQGDQKP